MKVKLSELKSNPFKKQISNGKLNKEIIKKIKGNMKELGLMGSLPVFKKDNQYYLVAGHHRTQALKETYGKDFQVEVTVHNYSDENVLRGMVVENLTQRTDELVEVTENLNAVRGWLKKNPACSAAELARRKDVKDVQDAGSVRNIYAWLNKNDEVMSIGKIQEYLKVYDNLDKTLLKKSKNSLDGKEEGTIGIEEAKILARIPREDQKVMDEVLSETNLDYKQKQKLTTQYLNSPEKVQERIKKKKIGLKEIDLAIVQHNLKEKKKGKIVVQDIGQKIDNLIYALSFSISDSETNLKGVLKDISLLSKYTADMNNRQKVRIKDKLENFEELLSNLSLMMIQIQENIQKQIV